MASFKLTNNIKQALLGECKRLTRLRVNAAASGFPLTEAQVIDITMPLVARQCFEKLAELGSDSRPRSYSICAIVPDALDGRAALVEISLAKPVDYIWDTQARSYRAQEVFKSWLTAPAIETGLPRPGLGSRIVIDTLPLDDEVADKFHDWVALAAREHSIGATTVRLVTGFLESWCSSTGELYRRWPGLVCLFDKLPSPWPERMRDVRGFRAGPSRWGWPSHGPAHEWQIENFHRMAGIDAVLVGCQGFDVPVDNHAPKLPVSAWILKVAPAREPAP